MQPSAFLLPLILTGLSLGASLRATGPVCRMTAPSLASTDQDVRDWNSYIEIETTRLTSGGYMSRIRSKQARRLLVKVHVRSGNRQSDAEYRIGPNGEVIAGYYAFMPNFTVKAISYY